MKEKICTRCKGNKPIDNFFVQSDRKSRSSMCKGCFSQYCMERWSARKIFAIQYKGGKCIDCGYCAHPSAMQFHHINPSEKEMTWIKMRLVSMDKMKKELDKCVLLCANCHFIRHSNQEFMEAPA